MNANDNKELAYLIVAGFGLLVAWRVWEEYVQPWANERAADVAGAQLDEGWVIDAIGISLIVLPVVVATLMIRSALRRRKTVN